MKKRLFTHEWLRTRSVLGIIAGGTLAIWLAGMVLATVGILPPLAIAACAIACVLLVPATSIYLVVDYWRSAYGRQGYLTHTLPVRGGTQYWQRLGYAVLVLTLALLLAVLLAGGAILLFTAADWGTWSNLVATLREAFTGLGRAEVLMILGVVLLVVLGTWAGQVQLYFAASFGSERLLGRFGVGGPVLAYVGLYLLLQLLGALSLLIPGAIALNAAGEPTVVTTGYYRMLFEDSAAIIMPLGVLILFAIVTAVLIWRTWYSWERKVSLR